MRVHVEKNELVVELSERIDASNAGAVEDEIREAIRLHPGQPLCLDARKLTYISSAGLRIMIKLRKELGPGSRYAMSRQRSTTYLTRPG